MYNRYDQMEKVVPTPNKFSIIWYKVTIPIQFLSCTFDWRISAREREERKNLPDHLTNSITWGWISFHKYWNGNKSLNKWKDVLWAWGRDNAAVIDDFASGGEVCIWLLRLWVPRFVHMMMSLIWVCAGESSNSKPVTFFLLSHIKDTRHRRCGAVISLLARTGWGRGSLEFFWALNLVE